MAARRRNLFLYLTLVCFCGLIAIFIADGYMGVYDTLSVTAGEWEQEIEPDQWSQEDRGWQQTVNVNRGGKAFFTYRVDNRRFSSYSADVDVTVWRSQEKVYDVVSQPISLGNFAEGQMEWVIDTAGLLPAEAPPEQGYQYTVVINRGEIEREIILNINPYYEPKPVPVPTR